MGKPDNEEEIKVPNNSGMVVQPVIPQTANTIPTPESSPAVEIPKDEVLEEIREATYKTGDVGEGEEEETEEVEDGRLLTGQKYEAPEDQDKFVDTTKGELIDKSKLTDFDVIKAVAKQTNTEIKNPRTSCKHCYGRGYIGWDSVTKAPIPCNCIYPPKTPDQKLKEHNIDKKNTPVKFNKKTYRQMKKLIKSERKLIKKQKAEEEKRIIEIEGK